MEQWNVYITTDTIFKNFEVLMEEHSSIFKEIEKEFKENLTEKNLA